MTTYPIRSLAAEITSMMISLLLMTVVFVGAILPALNDDAPQAEHSGRIVGGSLFMAMFLAFGLLSLRGVREIRVRDDGTIEFVRRLGTQRMWVTEIRALSGEYRADYDGNRTNWRLTIHTAHGKFKFGEFDRVKRFADQIQTLHPGVDIEGLWPFAFPRPRPVQP